MATAAILAAVVVLLTLMAALFMVWWLVVCVCFLPLIALGTYLAERWRRRVERTRARREEE